MPVKYRRTIGIKDFCYGWWRVDRYLYIGYTSTGQRRFAGHQYIDGSIELEEHDEIHFWVPQAEENKPDDVARAINTRWAYEYEKVLHVYYKPELNNHELGLKKDKQKCQNCNQQFKVNRSWQKYCSIKCRDEAFQKKHSPPEGVTICRNPNGCGKEYVRPVLPTEYPFLCPECREVEIKVVEEFKRKQNTAIQ